MGVFAVIDTETNWDDRVMSIGTVLGDAETFRPVAVKYHILTPEYLAGGMYEHMLLLDRLRPAPCSRKQAMDELRRWFSENGVTSVFAYNACFDRGHLPELSGLDWYDILRLAAYRQYNDKIPACADCYATGRLKRSYGVEPMLRLLTGRGDYRETHNALCDALDELEIMRLLGHPVGDYPRL